MNFHFLAAILFIAITTTAATFPAAVFANTETLRFATLTVDDPTVISKQQQHDDGGGDIKITCRTIDAAEKQQHTTVMTRFQLIVVELSRSAAAAATTTQPSSRTSVCVPEAQSANDVDGSPSRYSFRCPDTLGVKVIRAYCDFPLAQQFSVPVTLTPFANSHKNDDRRAETTRKGSYHSYDDIVARMNRLEERFASLVKVYPLSPQTHEGRTIYAAKLSFPVDAATVTKRTIFIGGTMHAREWISAETSIGLLEAFVYLLHWNKSALQTISAFDWIFVPVINPDGYEFSRTSGNRLWRKNRNPNGPVDLNRNFVKNWGLSSGSSGTPSSDTYRGESAGSEPETKAIMSIFSAYSSGSKIRDLQLISSNIALAFSLHSYGRQLLIPPGHELGATTDTFNLSRAMFTAARDVAVSHGGLRYSVDPAWALYPVSGEMIDWIHATFGNVPASTTELRPGNNDCCAFVLAEDQIYPTIHEQVNIILNAAETARRSSASTTRTSPWFRQTTNDPIPLSSLQSTHNTQFFSVCPSASTNDAIAMSKAMVEFVTGDVPNDILKQVRKLNGEYNDGKCSFEILTGQVDNEVDAYNKAASRSISPQIYASAMPLLLDTTRLLSNNNGQVTLRPVPFRFQLKLLKFGGGVEKCTTDYSLLAADLLAARLGWDCAGKVGDKTVDSIVKSVNSNLKLGVVATKFGPDFTCMVDAFFAIDASSFDFNNLFEKLAVEVLTVNFKREAADCKREVPETAGPASAVLHVSVPQTVMEKYATNGVNKLVSSLIPFASMLAMIM